MQDGYREMNTTEQNILIAKAFKRGHIRKLYEDIKMCNKAYDKGKQEAQKETAEKVKKLKESLKDMFYYRTENGKRIDVCLEEIDKIFKEKNG